jgi:NAD(P)-dependent dehydrogenase (short-subunit alcohol dehydrogenase family)
MKLKNKNVIITGASIGFGKALAEKFLEEGANISICSRDEVKLNDTKKELVSKFPSNLIFSKKCDVSVENEVKTFIKQTIEVFNKIDVIVLNAGVNGPFGPFDQIPLDEWKKSIDINLFGVLIPCREIVNHFKENKHGKIIVLSGGGATSPMPNLSAYAASKSAVVRLAETLSKELLQYNIDVNTIAPGALSTRMTQRVLDAGPELVGEDFFKKNKQWKETGATPLEFGTGLAVYLASTESNGITGKLISAQWDNWKKLHEYIDDLKDSDIYTLRRIIPEDRNKKI